MEMVEVSSLPPLNLVMEMVVVSFPLPVMVMGAEVDLVMEVVVSFPLPVMVMEVVLPPNLLFL
jgi:hypothetical protein